MRKEYQHQLVTFVIVLAFVTAWFLISQRAKINELEEAASTPAEPVKLFLSPEVEQIQESDLRDEVQLCRAELARTRGDIKDREKDINKIAERLNLLQDRLVRISRIANEE